ncbi:FAD-dependent oxidoreductase [bacterium]|nr:MAG: FAD-dependent oxidoreductase [bacterium]
MPKVVILGAGLTGLSTAYHLEKAGFFDYQLFEKQDRAGGLLRSFQQDGFTFDFTGHLLHISDSYFKSFLQTTANLDNFNLVQRRSGIYLHHQITDYPFQINLHGRDASVIYDCLNGFINRHKSLKKPQNFYEWVLKYFGKGFGKHFFFPYQAKILSCDIKKLMPSWTGRFVPKTTLKDIVYGAVKTKTGVGYNSSFYYPKQGGIEFIIKNITPKLSNQPHINHNASIIDLADKKIHFDNGNHTSFEILVTTLPLDQLLTSITNASHTTWNQTSKKLSCAGVLNFNIGFDKEDIADKHWLYYPEKQYPFYRLGFWNNINPTSVKQGSSAIYGECSYLRGSKTMNQLEQITKNALSKALETLHLTHDNIITQKILNLEHAYVIYDQWREKNLTKLLANLQEHNIYSIGRFGEWKYSSMQEAVLDGKKVAETILAQLGHTHTSTPPSLPILHKPQHHKGHRL